MAVPSNEIIRNETTAYLKDMTPENAPTVQTIESELLDKVNDSIEIENAGRPKRNQLSFLKVLTPWQVAQVLLKTRRVIRIAPSGKKTSAMYDVVGIYAEDGEDEGTYITDHDRLMKEVQQLNISADDRYLKEVLRHIRQDAARRYATAQRDLVPVANGVFDFAAKELLPFSPDYVFTSKVQTRYNAGAVNVVIYNDEDGTYWDVESWMESLSDDPGVVHLLWEILSALVRPYVSWNRAAFLFSELGNNGKGTYCELGRNLLGPGSCASIPIEDFGKDFLLEPLLAALAIIVDENNVGSFNDKAANLKAVITNDVISINRKFLSPIAYQFHGFMIQCLNEMSRSKDKSESFYRRQLFVPFTKSFKGIEQKYIKDDYLARPAVLEYVLLKVLHMDHYELSEPQACTELLQEQRIMNDTTLEYWVEHEDQFVWDFLPFSFLHDHYSAWMDRVHPKSPKVSKKMLTSRIVQHASPSSIWDPSDYKNQVRLKPLLTAPEPLISRYNLTYWMNAQISGDRRNVPVLDQNDKDRGLKRVVAPSPMDPAALAALHGKAEREADGHTAHLLTTGQQGHALVVPRGNHGYVIEVSPQSPDVSLWDAAAGTYNGQPPLTFENVDSRFQEG